MVSRRRTIPLHRSRRRTRLASKHQHIRKQLQIYTIRSRSRNFTHCMDETRRTSRYCRRTIRIPLSWTRRINLRRDTKHHIPRSSLPINHQTNDNNSKRRHSNTNNKRMDMLRHSHRRNILGTNRHNPNTHCCHF